MEARFFSIDELWDEAEYHPVREIEPLVFEQCREGREDFWSVYVHLITGGLMCVADVETKEQAASLASLLEICSDNRVLMPARGKSRMIDRLAKEKGITVVKAEPVEPANPEDFRGLPVYTAEELFNIDLDCDEGSNAEDVIRIKDLSDEQKRYLNLK